MTRTNCRREKRRQRRHRRFLDFAQQRIRDRSYYSGPDVDLSSELIFSYRLTRSRSKNCVRGSLSISVSRFTPTPDLLTVIRWCSYCIPTTSTVSNIALIRALPSDTHLCIVLTVCSSSSLLHLTLYLRFHIRLSTTSCRTPTSPSRRTDPRHRPLYQIQTLLKIHKSARFGGRLF